jgi:hypothetical protein
MRSPVSLRRLSAALLRRPAARPATAARLRVERLEDVLAPALTITPAGLQPGQQFTVLAVSDSTTTAASGVVATYDALVAGDAGTAGVTTFGLQPVTWQALVSTAGGTTAVGRFNPTVPVYRMDGTRLANNGADLWDGSLAAEPNRRLSGGGIDTNVWTGMNADGTAGTPLGDGQGDSTYGKSSKSDGQWANGGLLTQAGSELPVYAFSSVLTYGDAYTVTTAADELDAGATAAAPGGTGLSLREAVALAEADPLPTAITFAAALAGQTLSLTQDDADGAFGPTGLVMSTDVRIDGAAAPGLSISGNTARRVFGVTATGRLSLSNLIVTGGSTTGIGGGVRVEAGGELTLRAATVVGNVAGQGGGIANAGTAVLEGSTVRNNTATNTVDEGSSSGGPFLFGGGGIQNLGGLTVRDSEVRDNSAIRGGGIQSAGSGASEATLVLERSTVAGNRAAGSGGLLRVGGGIDLIAGGQPSTATLTNVTVAGNTSVLFTAGISVNFASLTALNSTISGNAAPNFGGIFNNRAVALVLNNTILAGNTGGDLDGGAVTGGGNNLIGGDPQLGPLQDNGGPTRTMAPARTSPAVDAGSNAAAAGLTTDQRGASRLVGGTVDIGAVELPPDTTPATLRAVRPVLANGNVVDISLLAWPAGKPLPWDVVGFEAEYDEAVAPTAGQAVVGGGATGTRLRWAPPGPLTLAAATAAGVQDAAGNPGLANPLAADRTFAVRVGDVSGDGRVTSADLAYIAAAIRTGYDPLADLNGDGLVDSQDLAIARGRIGR